MTIFDALDTAQWINLYFALSCLVLAAGGNTRVIALVSALLYVALVYF